MRYSSEITIHLSRAKVVDLFDNPNNLHKWMKGLQSLETFEGEPGQEGAKSQLFFQIGKRKIEMVETILKRDLPDFFLSSYESTGVYNEVENHFIDQGAATLYKTVHYFRFESWAMRLKALLMPGALFYGIYQRQIP